MSEAIRIIDVGFAADEAQTLNEQLQAVLTAGGLDRPWLFWEWHNPWSRAAACIDSWAVHDMCAAAGLLRSVAEHIGDDIVLFDTQLVPNPALPEADRSLRVGESGYFPLEAAACGAVVRLPVGDTNSGVHLRARYFPADLKYSRDPLHPAHVTLTERFPWVNYRTMPLWLVAGKDRAGNDFVTGFNPKPGRWTAAGMAGSPGSVD